MSSPAAVSPAELRPAGGPPPKRDDTARLAEMNTMKRVATGLLAVALAVFVVARWLEPTYPWVGFVRATAEASLIGGLADWFAVTALFRRPLGLPIPHTAIIQTQKDRIGRILGGFVQNHFLSKDVLSSKLLAMGLAERAARWLNDPANSARLARQLAVGVAQVVETIPPVEAGDLIRESAVARLRAVPLGPVVADLLAVVATEDLHQTLLDEALRLVRDTLEKNRDELHRKIKEESPWWVPGAVDQAFQRRIEAATQRLVEEVKSDPRHPLRLKFDTAFRDFVDRLRHAPDVIARTEALKEELLKHPAVEEFAASLWERARRTAARLTTEADPAALQPLARGLGAVGGSLLANGPRLAELNDFLTNFLASVLEQHRQEVADLIAETVRRWDPEVAAQRIELAVGRDLQFIRLNGTLVGGLAGLIIYTVSILLH